VDVIHVAADEPSVVALCSTSVVKDRLVVASAVSAVAGDPQADSARANPHKTADKATPIAASLDRPAVDASI
jgi:hypothetical protein